MLTLPIKKKWFELIKSGIKKEEYREVKPYYYTRFQHLVGQELVVKLRNGYLPLSPSIICKCKVGIGFGNPEWGAEPNRFYYVLEILEVM